MRKSSINSDREHKTVTTVTHSPILRIINGEPLSFPPFELLDLMSRCVASSPCKFLALTPLPDTWKAHACFLDLPAAQMGRGRTADRGDTLTTCTPERSTLRLHSGAWTAPRSRVCSCAKVIWGRGLLLAIRLLLETCQDPHSFCLLKAWVLPSWCFKWCQKDSGVNYFRVTQASRLCPRVAYNTASTPSQP